MPVRPRLLLSAALLLAPLAACAPTAGPERTVASAAPRTCFYQDDVRNFRASQDGRNVYVRGLDKTVYRLETLGVCHELDNALAIGFAPMGGVNSLCTGDYTRLVVGGGVQTVPCRVRLAGALTEAEVAALAERDRP